MSERLDTGSQHDGCDDCGSNAELRPVCTTDGEIPALCSVCFVQRRDAGEIDRQRDREVFGYAF